MPRPLSQNLREVRPAVWAPDQPVAPAAAARTVLAIDDDPMLLELMSLILSEAGCTVLTATRGTQGLQLLGQAAGAVDVVLLDYQMPVLNGAQVLAGVRQLAPAVKVVGLSGADPCDLPPEFREGVDQFLQKPFTRDSLVAAVGPLVAADTPEPVGGCGFRSGPAAARRPLVATLEFKHA